MPDLVTRMAPATHVIGIDEVGRGCLMGPLAVAAVINPLGWRHAEVKDSKAIRSERKRYRIAENIVQNVMWNLVEVQPHVINEVGISKALESAYVMALGDILDRRRSFASAGVCEIILDGLMMEGVYKHFHAPGRVHVTAMVGADARVFESSCAVSSPRRHATNGATTSSSPGPNWRSTTSKRTRVTTAPTTRRP